MKTGCFKQRLYDKMKKKNDSYLRNDDFGAEGK